MADLYDRLGFAATHAAADGDGRVQYVLDLDRSEPPVTFIARQG